MLWANRVGRTHGVTVILELLLHASKHAGYTRSRLSHHENHRALPHGLLMRSVGGTRHPLEKGVTIKRVQPAISIGSRLQSK